MKVLFYPKVWLSNSPCDLHRRNASFFSDRQAQAPPPPQHPLPCVRNTRKTISVVAEVSASVHAEIHPPGRHPPRQTPPPWADTPSLGRHPLPGQTPPPLGSTPPPRSTPPPHDGHCSGQYASYWNAFLFHRRLSVRGGGGGAQGQRPPPYGKERALCILLVCILYLYFFKSTFTSELIIKSSIQNTSLINIYHPRAPYFLFLWSLMSRDLPLH